MLMLANLKGSLCYMLRVTGYGLHVTTLMNKLARTQMINL